MRHVAADIETDGLLDALTVIHCLSVRDVETGEVLTCADQPGYTSIDAGLDVVANAETAYFHNGVRFDIPAIQKVKPGWSMKGTLRDTFVIAAMRWAHAKDADYDLARAGKFPARFAGSHSLEAWGHRLGVQKGEYTQWCKDNGIEDPWAQWRPEMSEYCNGDTDTTRALALKIREAGVSPESVEIEHELAHYLFLQEQNGWPFDMEKAATLAAKLSARRQQLHESLVAKFGEWDVPDGKPLVPKRDNAKLGYVKGQAVQKTKRVEFNPKSGMHVERCLKVHYGWKPSKFTKSGRAEITEETLEALAEIPEAALVHEYLTVQKRLGMLSEGREAWLKHARLNPQTGMYHIHGRVKQGGTITHRASHVSPNLAQVPKVGSQYGAECRTLFTVPPGWVQIGADVSGLELRCLSHYMAKYDGGAYGEVVLHGDIHTTNQKAAGLATRDEAKTFIYAYLYGEGDEARGAKFLPKTATKEQRIKKGRQVSKQFTAGLPALGKLQDAVQSKLSKKGGPGYLLMPDGRRTYIRHEHAALNSLLQASGAIICRRWTTECSRRLTERFGPQGWGGKWAALGFIHDELQVAVRPEIADEVKTIMVEAVRFVGQHYRWRVPLDGEAKCGRQWAECH